MDREQMIQALGLASKGGIDFDGEDEDGSKGRYIDWSVVRYSGKRAFEFGDGYSTAQFDLSRAEVMALHAALTALLLTDER